jgi:hypothetical protein
VVWQVVNVREYEMASIIQLIEQLGDMNEWNASYRQSNENERLQKITI